MFLKSLEMNQIRKKGIKDVYADAESNPVG